MPGNSPLRWTNDGFGSIPRIIPIATADVNSSIQVRAILTLSDTATTLPDYVYANFKETLRNGILGRLMKIPGKDWTDMAAAATYLNAFEVGKTEARSRAKAEYGQPNRVMSYGGIGGDTTVGYDDYGQ